VLPLEALSDDDKRCIDITITQNLKNMKEEASRMARGLKKYFPTIRTKGEILQEIRQNKELNDLFDSWKEEHQREFLDFTSGMKGVKVLYDSF
jgi:hypothetical protein